MVKVMGILTLDTEPGLNFHRRKVLTAASSSIGLPILCVTEASVTLPDAGSTFTVITPLPMI